MHTILNTFVLVLDNFISEVSTASA